MGQSKRTLCPGYHMTPPALPRLVSPCESAALGGGGVVVRV